ncbi:PD-(D/E)XK motif protein [Alphaproteobacteria bacterium]|nr:PD-(D/E)XK motif protein [Alphaproteobacteria bacterium]
MPVLRDINPWNNIPAPIPPRFFNRKKVQGTVSQKFVWLVDKSGKKGIGIEFQQKVSDDFSVLKLKNLEFKIQPDGKTLTILLLDEALVRQFRIFCEDCIDSIERILATTSARTLQALGSTVNRWLDLFKNSKKKFSSSMEIGVFGELFILNNVLNKKFQISDCVHGWRGPKRDEQDFLLNNALIEVKSQMASRDRVVTISSLDQLDCVSGQIFLVHLGLSATTKSMHNALSLSQLVDNILAKTKGDNYVTDTLLGNLQLANYEHGVTESTTIFSTNFVNFFKVDDSFPKLIRKDVPSAIDRASYSLDMAVMGSWQTSETTMLQEIGS